MGGHLIYLSTRAAADQSTGQKVLFFRGSFVFLVLMALLVVFCFWELSAILERYLSILLLNWNLYID